MNERSTYTRIFALILLCAVGVSCTRPLSISERMMLQERVELLLTEATIQMRKGTDDALDEAEGALKLAWEIFPSEAKILDGLGCVAWRRRQFSLAESFFKDAVELNPSYSRAYAHLAFAAERRGDGKTAKEQYEKAISLNPLDSQTRNNYAVFLASKGGSEGAKRRSYGELLKAVNSGNQNDLVARENLEQMRRLSNNRHSW